MDQSSFSLVSFLSGAEKTKKKNRQFISIILTEQLIRTRSYIHSEKREYEKKSIEQEIRCLLIFLFQKLRELHKNAKNPLYDCTLQSINDFQGWIG